MSGQQFPPNQMINAELKQLVSEKKLTYHIITYGCAMNEHDSEMISGILASLGFQKADEQHADLLLFNTCCVRENAENRLYGNVGALRKVKEENPDKLIGVCGCMMQQKEYADELKRRFPFVDLIFGTHNVQNLPELLLKAFNHQKQVQVFDVDGYVIEDLPVIRQNAYSAYINIMYGCNNYCTYCIVPYVRGRERSRESGRILAEARQAVQNGATEIILLGQNVNSYNRGEKDLSFPQLLRALNEIEGVKRIRYLTSHPKDLSDELITAIAACERVCKQIHLPVQAGDNQVLKAMNRGYTRAHYLERVEKLRKAVPEIGLTTDIIVGFPGETEEQFLHTLDLLKTVGFDSVFSFMYSVRKGTKAEQMVNQVPEEQKRDRLSRLMTCQGEIGRQLHEALVGTVCEVLVEKKAKRQGQVCGKSDRGTLVNLPGDEKLIGSYVPVWIRKANTNSVYGERIE